MRAYRGNGWTYGGKQLIRPPGRQGPDPASQVSGQRVFNPPAVPWREGIYPFVDPVTGALLVSGEISIISEVAKIPFWDYQENTSVSFDTETLVYTLTVATLRLMVDSLNMTGSWDGIWTIFINSVLKMQKRTSAADRVSTHYFDPAFPLAIGDKLEIKVTHDYSPGSRSFNVAVVGHRVA